MKTRRPTLLAIIEALESDPRFFVRRCGGCIWVEIDETGHAKRGCYVSHGGLLWAGKQDIVTAYVLACMAGMN